MTKLIRALFFLLIVRPFVFVFLGPYVRYRERLPERGPAIIIANHNSHLDTVVLMCLFPLGNMLRYVRPVAAADYWLRNPLISWFALKVIGVVPICRRREVGGKVTDPLDTVSEALDRGYIVIFYPEGTRGEPERMGHFKAGIARLAERHPTVPIVPVFLQGTGKALPRGEGLVVPFICDAYVGESVLWDGHPETFHHELEARLVSQAQEAKVSAWT